MSIGGWLSTWWWVVVAAVAIPAALAVFSRSWRPEAVTGRAFAVRWDSSPGTGGLIARRDYSSAGLDVPTRNGRWNWSVVTSVVTAFAALGALVFTGLSLSATEQGQVTDRYTKAIDQIGTQGDDRLQVRLGGVYALERLAHDSPNDQPTIVEVLSAFARGGLPRHVEDSSGSKTCPAPTSKLVQISPDVQAAFRVLGRRDHGHDQGAVTDLRSVCLNRTKLVGVDFRGADFSGSDLKSADWRGSDLSGTRFVGAYLVEMILDHANLESANFEEANFGGANLKGAMFGGANLKGVDFKGASLEGAHLDHVDLTSVEHDDKTKTDGATHEGSPGAWW